MRRHPLEYQIKINDQYSIYIRQYLKAPLYLLKVAQDNNLMKIARKSPDFNPGMDRADL